MLDVQAPARCFASGGRREMPADGWKLAVVDEEADRLEAALDRIARAAARRGRAPRSPGSGGVPATDAEELAARLDLLIAELRTALGPAS